MSLVIAVKDKNRFVFGADKQSSTGYNKDHSGTKIWEVQDLPGAIMGSVGSARASQVVQYNNIIDLNDVANGGITTNYIINSLIPTIVSLLKVHGINHQISKNDEDRDTSWLLPNSYLFAYEDKAWLIWNDLSVIEIENYIAIGSGSDVANGALFATKDKNPFERIVTSIDAAAETTLFVDNGVDLLATKYYEKDIQLMNDALEIEIMPIEKETAQKKTTKTQTSKTKKATNSKK